MNPQAVHAFQETVWAYYAAHGRHGLPWRQPLADGSFDPYRIWVSEIMLQQTQVSRVIPKFVEFIQRFPDVQALAAAPLDDVLRVWSGLGYNRRAKFIWEAARIVKRQGGLFPESLDALIRLPGIGRNTAGAVVAYSYNQPVVFIETNVRSVFIHHFFADREAVSDAELRPIIEQTLSDDEIREWYWALMDYGTHLKQTTGNAARRSVGYAKQSRFEGSKRQIRGRVLQVLLDGPQTQAHLVSSIIDERLPAVLEDLAKEGFIERRGSRWALHKS
jgi:A/G-specific adenine glycosylase